MRSKVTVVLLFLNVVLFFYIFRYEHVVLPDANGRRVYGPEVAALDSLTRTIPNGPTVKLERRGESWWLTQPYDWPANPNASRRLINELQFLEHETSFAVADLAKSGQTLTDYGLEQPAITLTFTSAGKSYTTRIGDDTKIGNRLYLLSPDGARIHVVGRSLADTVGLPLADLRSDSIFTVPVFEVRALNVQTAAPSNLKVRLRRDAAARWVFDAPILARASKKSVESTITDLNTLNAKTFLEPRNTDLDRAGLTAPALRVTLEGNARRETLLLGNAAAEGEYFAKIEDKAVVFTVVMPPPLLKSLRFAQEELRDPRVLDFEPATITALGVAAPGQPALTLQRLEAAAGEQGWQAVVRVSGQAPLTTAADTALVTELLQKLQFLSAQVVTKDLPNKFLSDAPSAADLEKWGFNRPEREITLSLNAGGGPHATEASTLILQVGVSPDIPGVAFARVTSGVTNAPVYQILPDILDETPALARHYRQRLLRELREGAKITGLALIDVATSAPIYSRQLAETDQNWDTALAAEPEARHKALTALLTQLRVLRARNFTADLFTPDHADTPQGARPWKYRLDASLSFPGGNGAAQVSTSTLFLTERVGGTMQLAGTAEFGGVVFELTQEMIDALFALTYAEKNDPGQSAPGKP